MAAIMLDPSTANESKNDQTVERVERRSRGWGFGRLLVVNLFAIRATNPADMLAAPEPIGEENDQYILSAAQEGDLVLCAWGNHGSHLDRSRHVTTMLRQANIPLHRLNVTGEGEPGHPLYLPYSLKPTPWEN